ncbi:MAG TPA: hypothetical protein VF267_07140 [Gammaproteobacteria bacterium]
MDATVPAIAYNNHSNEFLVVYRADTKCNGCYGLYGQFLKADLTPDGASFTIYEPSQNGRGVAPDANAGAPDFGRVADVVFDAAFDEFLVVWAADEDPNDPAALADDEFEIFAAKVRTDGSLWGSILRVSNAGASLDARTQAFAPQVAKVASGSERMVVWQQDDASKVDGKFSVWAQQVEDSGSLTNIGNPVEVAVMDAGPEADPALYSAVSPDVAFNGSQFLVAWAGKDIVLAPKARAMTRTLDLDGNLGAINVIEGGGNISTLDASGTRLAWNETTKTAYLTWDTPVFNGRLDASAMPLTASGQALAGEAFRLPVNGYTGFSGWGTAIAAIEGAGGFALANAPLNDLGAGDEFEILLAVAGGNGLPDDERTAVSETGAAGSLANKALNPAIAYNSTDSELVVVWQADELVQGEEEIFAQRLKINTADISLANLTADSTSVDAGEDILIETELTNASAIDLNGVRLKTQFSTPQQLVNEITYSLSSESFANIHDCDVLDCEIGALAANDSARIKVTVGTESLAGQGDLDTTLRVSVFSELADLKDADNVREVTLSVTDSGTNPDGDDPGGDDSDGDDAGGDNSGDDSGGSGGGGSSGIFFLVLLIAGRSRFSRRQ